MNTMRDYFDLNNLCEIKKLYLFNCIYLVFFRNQESNGAVEKPDNCKTFSQQTKSQNLVGEKLNTFKCSVCTKSFCKEKSLKIHCLVHNREKSNSCSVCNKLCTCAKDLKLHVETQRRLLNL